MEATTIPITSLSPADAPPASKSIRAVVSLLWPYSSSTKQCALLLADPDFRLRNRKGQVRVRLTGASAEAVANARIGIGDELVLELGGAQWAAEQARVATPGKSVDGELVFGGQLALSVTRKANGEQSDLRIQVNESTPALEEPEKPVLNGSHATPARAAPLWMRSSMRGADVTPIYSSPAFVKRLRLSGDMTSWDPFADVERELDDDLGPRKRQRTSFGGVKRWKLTDRTPSPEKEAPNAMEIEEHSNQNGLVQSLPASETPSQQVRPAPGAVAQVSSTPHMPPPPLPRLQLPSESQFAESQHTAAAEDDGPSTPKLHPVPSSALPLPSPFPTEASKVHFGIQSPEPTAKTNPLEALVEAAETAREIESSGRNDPPEETAAEEFSSVVTNKPELVLPEAPAKGHEVPAVSPAASLASTAEIVHEEESPRDIRDIDTDSAQLSMSREEHSNQQAQRSHPEYLSDTEEDEDMYYDHMRRRFPSVTESGRVRVDHQEEGYYDDLSQLHEKEVEEVIETDAMGEEPQSEESGEVTSDKDEGDDAAPIIQDEPSIQPPDPAKTDKALETLRDAREELRQETRETLKTPTRPPPGLFGFDGAINDTPFQPKSTPQSEKDRIMAKTFSSLFGFRASPSPELPKQQEVQTPTPAMPIGHLSQIAKERLEAARAPVETSKEAEAEDEHVTAATEPEYNEQNVEIRKDQPPVVREYFETTDTAMEEAAQATEETGRSVPAADVQDGSLLSAVRADEAGESLVKLSGNETMPGEAPVVGETPQPQEMPTIDETPQLDVEMQDADEDPVPDGVSINQGLGAAIAPDRNEELQQPPSDSAPKPTEITVIDLGDSSDEEEQPEQALQQPSNEAAEPDLRPEPQAEEPFHLDFTQPEMLPSSQFPLFPLTQTAHRHAAQDSQGSALQPDMLDTTQTTVDRSEVVTPVAEEFDTVIADTSQEDALWLNQGQQDGFFAGQMPNQEFEGAAMPQLTQQPTGTLADPYRYVSFQSATSVATDSSDNLPPTAVQSFAQEESQIESVPLSWPERMSLEERSTVVQQSSPLQLDPSFSVPEIASQPRIEGSETLQIDETPQDEVMTQRDEAPIREPELLQSVEQASGAMEVDSVQLDSSSQQAQRLDPTEIRSSLEHRLSEDIAVEHMPPHAEAEVMEAATESETLEESQGTEVQNLPPSEQASYPALPISPEESQHRLESQGFETQVPYHHIVPSELPPTPKLTQGDSLTENEVQVVVKEADEEAASSEPTTLPRTRRSQTTADKNLESPAKKTPIRKSPRKSQAEESQHQEEQTEPPKTSQRRRQSVQHDTNKTLLSTAKKTPVRRSPRKSQATAEFLEEKAEHEEDEAEEPNPEASPQQASLISAKKTPVRRSARKTQAESQTSEKGSEQMDDDTNSLVPQAKPSTRQSTRKVLAQSQTEYGGMGSAELAKASEGIEDPISVTSSTKPTIRQSARKARARSEDDETTVPETVPPPTTPATSRKSFTSQLGRVPAVIADWFSPRRSSRIEHEEVQPGHAVDGAATLKREKSNGLLTALSYFTPLSNLEEKANPASQYQTDNTVDVLAVVTDETKAPERAKGGPKDFFTIFRIADSSLPADDSIRAEVFRPWHATLPTAQVGDVVLLRAFAVKTRKRKPYLLSTDSSAWCVWRYAEGEGEDMNREKRTPTRKRRVSFSVTSSAREEIKGPPVELGEEERQRVAALRKWWLESKEQGLAEEKGQVSPRTARTTRSQKL